VGAATWNIYLSGRGNTNILKSGPGGLLSPQKITGSFYLLILSCDKPEIERICTNWVVLLKTTILLLKIAVFLI